MTRNEIVIAHGPIAGITQYQVREVLGGYFISTNPYAYGQQCRRIFWALSEILRFDALSSGKAEKDVIIFIDGNRGIVQIMESDVEERTVFAF